MDIAGFIIAVLSLAFGAFTYLRHDKKLKEQQAIINAYEIQKHQQESVEQKKADVRASMINKFVSDFCTGTLVIKNYGKATAQRVFVSCQTHKHTKSLPAFIPIDQLVSQEYREFPVSWHFFDGGEYQVTISWSDDFADNFPSSASILSAMRSESVV